VARLMATKTKPMKRKKNPPAEPDIYSQYRNMLGTRYASSSMVELFSERNRAKIWRTLWIILADEERKLGLPISPKQVKALESAKDDIDFERIQQFERQLKHDVMSHLKAFAEKAPSAEPIIHLGATSAFITDNADAYLLREGSELISRKIISILKILGESMLKYKSLEVTGFTHFQPAQPVTLGKRFALWAQDLIWDLTELRFSLERYQPLGCKGTTGTQASFFTLFNGDSEKVRKLDEAVCKRMGFRHAVYLSGQTLSRKADVWFLHALANLGSSFSKMSYDMRLLQHLREVTEPFGEKQVGSSAMPYKQNPMLAERITGLSRFLMTLAHNGPWTHATQWLERSLDDSSNRRIVLPEAFLTADALCEATYRMVKGLKVNKDEIGKRLSHYRDLFETEGEMMLGTLKGGSRQELHEEIRTAMLQKKIRTKKKSARLSGVAAEQVEEFYEKVLKPILKSSKVEAKFDSATL
jgi:adenylosuccinate lyase